MPRKARFNLLGVPLKTEKPGQRAILSNIASCYIDGNRTNLNY